MKTEPFLTVSCTNPQAATAYQFHIVWLAEIEKGGLSYQGIPCSVLKFYQTSQHADGLHAAGFHIPSAETYFYFKAISRRRRSDVDHLQIKMKDCDIE